MEPQSEEDGEEEKEQGEQKKRDLSLEATYSEGTTTSTVPVQCQYCTSTTILVHVCAASMLYFF